MKYRLSEQNVEAIEKVVNQSGYKEAAVKVENGKIVVLQVEKKKIG